MLHSSVSANSSTCDLPTSLYRASQVRALDQQLMASTGLTSIELMSRAAAYALEVLLARYPWVHHLYVFAGTGNNGGDGYFLAKMAASRGLAVDVLEPGDIAKLSADVKGARSDALAAGVRCACFTSDDTLCVKRDSVVVDAMLGTGLSREPSEEFSHAIAWINEQDARVLALDVPSGLSSDTGMALGLAVRADATVSFIGLKQGLFTGQGPELCGQIFYGSLGLGEEITQLSASASQVSRVDYPNSKHLLSRRRRDAHKGSCGSVLVLGGDDGFGGAAMMAAEAATRSGAGTVTLITRSANVTAMLSRRPEVMALGIDCLDESALGLLHKSIVRASAIVIGPGLGTQSWGQALLNETLRMAGRDKPILVDADALNLLASKRADMEAMTGTGSGGGLGGRNWVLTPHPGEAARLLGKPLVQLQSDRFACAHELLEAWGGVCVLKGAGSLLCYGQTSGDVSVNVCTEGNPGMASGGMGDVLSGIIGALLAQGLNAPQAARLGVCVHGEAADLAALDNGERGLLATDLLPYVRRLLNDC
ncbi:MAG: NAD(P)H-hydrate dehydratase [Pseudohongiellaceae bacterium]|nr:NAD(P)H-hydrate dehydratase [Pseudohongiellaceae bacterium]